MSKSMLKQLAETVNNLSDPNAIFNETSVYGEVEHPFFHDDALHEIHKSLHELCIACVKYYKLEDTPEMAKMAYKKFRTDSGQAIEDASVVLKHNKLAPDSPINHVDEITWS